MPRPLETRVFRAILQFFTSLPILQNCTAAFLPRFCSVAAPGVTPRLTARNAPGPPIRAAEPLFLPPAVNSCTV